MNLQELFKAVGKQIFVKYYYYFKDSRNYSVSDIVDIIEEDYTEKSKRSRTGHARMIFNNSWNIEALKIISNSNVPIETIHECKKILAEELANINKTESKNKISNEFLKKQLSKNNIEYKSLKNSFYEINLSDNKYLLKCRTYNNNYTFVTKSEIPELSDNVLIALVEWQNEQPMETLKPSNNIITNEVGVFNTDIKKSIATSICNIFDFKSHPILDNILSMYNFLFNPKTPNDIAKELVGKIKQQRKKLKISQAQLA